LVGLVETELGQQIESGDLFLFFNRRRDRVKVLYFVGDGLVIFYRMLEQGTFEVPAATAANSNTAGVELRLSDLTLILEGIELASVKRRKRWRREPQPT
jgi:transposase